MSEHPHPLIERNGVVLKIDGNEVWVDIYTECDYFLDEDLHVKMSLAAFDSPPEVGDDVRCWARFDDSSSVKARKLTEEELHELYPALRSEEELVEWAKGISV